MGDFSVGRVFSRAFGLVRDTVTSVGLFTLILVLLEGGASYFVQSSLLKNLSGMVGPTGRLNFDAALASLFGMGSLLGILVLGFSWAGGVGGMLVYARTGRSTLGDCLTTGVSGFLPVLAITVLYWTGFAIGWLFLIVPGVILACMWAVTVPAYLAEDAGILGAFGRSRDLTRGNRLSIFGVFLLMIVGYYILSFVVLGSVLGMSGTSLLRTVEDVQSVSALALVVSLPISWLSAMVVKAVVTALYIETVEAKGGLPGTAVAGVFD